MTLCFLAYQPERDIERIAQVVCGIEPRPVTIRFEAEPIAAPRSRPRLFAVDAPSDEAVALQAELSDRLEAERFYKPEKRPFWPHVTVARVQAGEAHPLRAPGAPQGPPGARRAPAHRAAGRAAASPSAPSG